MRQQHGLDNPSITENLIVLRNVPACGEDEAGGGGGGGAAVGSPLLVNSRIMLLSMGLHLRKRLLARYGQTLILETKDTTFY